MIDTAAPAPTFWRGKRVLLTGHTGFKGAWLMIWLSRLQADVLGFSLPPSTSPSLYALANVGALGRDAMLDIRDSGRLAAAIRAFEPEIVFHLAAQALVRPSYRDPLATFSTNVMGTAHVLDALRGLSAARVVVAVTTDKVYENHEHGLPYRETDTLGGHDPYSASKAAAELIVASYRRSFLSEQGIRVASARAGNVIGGGDWSEDRLIPDAVRAWNSGARLRIRRPEAIRPWQHVLEPLAGYLRLAERLWDRPDLAGAFNFGPLTHEASTVRAVVELAGREFGRGETEFDAEPQGPHEAGTLSLETAKSRALLGLAPRWSLATAVARTMSWYRAVLSGADARAACAADIAAFELPQAIASAGS